MTNIDIAELKSRYLRKNKQLLDTPCLTIDRGALNSNLRFMQARAEKAGKKVRPHVKTHKCSALARLQLEAGSIGVCAAKVSEAEGLVNSGVRGVLITSPVVTEQKIERLLRCAALDSQLMIVLDNFENARALNAASGNAGLILKVLVDVDPGLQRTGICYEDAPALARAIAELEHLELMGIQCYAGNLQHVFDFAERKAASQSTMRRAGEVVRALRASGLACPILTGTGTGTYDIDCEVPEVSEIQTGSYAVMDAEYHNIGSAEDARQFSRFQFALTLLSTVISTNHETHVTIDAGLKAVYQDPTKPIVLRPEGLRYDWFGDEHGKLSADRPEMLPRSGEVVEMAVSHCDPTINLHDCFFVTEGDIVVDIWPIDLRGNSQ